MATKTDYVVVPLHRRDGQEQSYLPGLHVADAQRAARGRAGEQLILHLSLPADAGLTPEQQHTLLDDMARGYFRTPGSVTSALRDQAERLNVYFQQLNQKLVAKGQPVLALLSMLSIREGRGMLAQCGPVQAFLLNGADIQHFFDPQTAGRGLGLSKNTDIRFFQCDLPSGAYMLLTPQLPEGWNERTFSNVSGQKLATLRRRFLSEAGPNLAAVLVAAEPGRGGVRLLTGKDIEAESPKSTRPQPASIPPRRRPIGRPVEPQPEASSWEQVTVPDAEADTEPFGIAQPELSPEADGTESSYEAEAFESETNFEPSYPAHEPEVETETWFSQISARLAVFGARVLPPLRAFLIRMLPEEPAFNLPPKTMALIAGIVPLAVVVLVSVVYLQFGRGQLYTNYLSQAQSAAAAAEARQDPAEVRQAWEIAVYYAERAAAYEQDAEVATALLAEAHAALDGLDGIERVNFQPALFEALPSRANISRIVATNTDMYLLDSTAGNILHAFLTGGGFQLDEAFACEPGPYGAYIVSNLVDMALLPRGNALDATLVAMDANGNLIYCFADERPLAVALVPPDSNWGNPLAISVENENLYILDPLTNGVWIFFGENYSFVEEPRFFFGAEVPSLQNMLDLGLSGEDLYLLDVDGHIAVCQFGGEIDDPTTCEDPVPFTDTRPGRVSGASVEGAHFAQMQITEPPEASVYLMDPIEQAVYQFSLQLNLLRQFKAQEDLPHGLATAFAVTSNRAILLAFENDIYIGFMP
jgi:hypothetical protein